VSGSGAVGHLLSSTNGQMKPAGVAVISFLRNALWTCRVDGKYRAWAIKAYFWPRREIQCGALK